jgi:hypothetical protein
VVGGLGGGAAPLPPNQNKKPPCEPTREQSYA